LQGVARLERPRGADADPDHLSVFAFISLFRMVALLPERKRQFAKPPLDAIRLNVREVRFILSGRSIQGEDQPKMARAAHSGVFGRRRRSD
jgi:hypothetical protein